MVLFRKLISALLVMLLIGSTAAAAPGDRSFFTPSPAGYNEDYVESMQVIGDVLYAVTNKGLYAYEADQEAPTLLIAREAIMPTAEDYTEFLLFGNKTLRLLDIRKGSLGTYADGAVTWEGTLDLEGLGEEEEWGRYLRLMYPVEMDDGLYVVYEEPNGDWDRKPILRFDLETGTYTEIPAGVQSIAPYQPGKLLAVTASDPGATEYQLKLRVIDAQTGNVLEELATLPSANSGAMAYDSTEGHIYTAGGSQVLRLEGNSWKPVNYVTANYANGLAGAYLPGGYYVIADFTGLLVRNTDPQYLGEPPLRLVGYGLENIATAFMTVHPEKPIVRSEQWFSSAADLQTALQAGGSEAGDIFLVSADSAFWSLMEKGFLKDLSEVKHLQDSVAFMYPQVQEAVSHEGKLYAYPYRLYLQAWQVRESLLADCGFDHLPETWQELFEMLADWEERKTGNDDEPIFLFSYAEEGMMRWQLLREVFLGYLMAYEQPGQPLSFDTPAFRDTMMAFETLPYDAVDPDTYQYAYNADTYERQRRSAILIDGYNALRNYEEVPTTMMPPPVFVKGEQPKVQGALDVAMVNPNSERWMDAIALLSYVAQNMDSENNITLHPDVNDPVPEPYMVEEKAEAQKQLEDLKARLETAEEEDKRVIEAEISNTEQWLVDMEQWFWQIDADKIAEYRQVAQYLTLSKDSRVSFLRDSPEASRQIWDLLKRYGMKLMSLDQFIAGLDKLIRMAYLEQQ